MSSQASPLFEDWVRIRVFTPLTHVSWMRTALDQVAARLQHAGKRVGTLGKYEAVRYEIPVVEHFIPLPGADAACQTPPPSMCVETWCPPELVKEVVLELRRKHPYEHPVIEVSAVQLVKAKPSPRLLGDYLHTIGLHDVLDGKVVELNTCVEESFERLPGALSDENVSDLYLYAVPKDWEKGSCSLAGATEPEPYNLARTFGLEYETEALKRHDMTVRLWRLKQVLTRLQQTVPADWLGIYRRVHNRDGREVLLKESYYGAMSRPEFPLTDEFAKTSNNSTVGITGKAVLVEDVHSYSGPYYECDKKVRSELCVPIFNTKREVAGILDVESFIPRFFTREKTLQIVKVCEDLGRVDNLFRGE